MARQTNPVAKSTFHAPIRFDWTDEKLKALTQEQLLNLLENLDRQRAIGRIPDAMAGDIDQRIGSLLTARNATKRRKQLAEFLAAAAAEKG
jgi:hypothetical protein